MPVTPLVLTLVAGTCVCASMSHMLVGLRHQSDGLTHVLFAIVSLFVAAYYSTTLIFV